MRIHWGYSEDTAPPSASTTSPPPPPHLHHNLYHHTNTSTTTPPPPPHHHIHHSLKSKEWIEYKPTNQINDTSAINFSITAQSSAYVDLKGSVLNVKLRLTNGYGTPVNEATVAGLVNTPLHSIFHQVDVTFQQMPLSHSGNNYPYKAYIDTILKTNENVQKGELTSQLFYKDVGPDTDDAKSGPNSGLLTDLWLRKEVKWLTWRDLCSSMCFNNLSYC